MISRLSQSGFRVYSDAITNFQYGNYFFKVFKNECRDDSLEVDLDLKGMNSLSQDDSFFLALRFNKILFEWINLYGENIFNEVRYQILDNRLIWELSHRLNLKNLELRKNNDLDLFKISRKIFEEE